MSLDDFNGESDEDIVEQFLWGPGHNRWVDKSFSVLITNEGKCGLNFEHAWGDGACVLSFFNKVHQHTLEHNLLQPGQNYDYGQGDVNEVHFVLDDGLKESINKATKDYAEHIGDLVISYARDYEVTRKEIGFTLEIKFETIFKRYLHFLFEFDLELEIFQLISDSLEIIDMKNQAKSG